MELVESFLVRYPELALFLAIALGYAFGEISFGGFQFGPVTGSLLAGLFIGQFAEVPAAGLAKSFLFLLFLFGIGYSVGPQFMQAARRDGLNSIILAFLCTTTGLGVAYGIATFLGLDAGLAAGLLSGALTQSAAMGTASETIGALPLPEAERALLVAHVAIADAVCYVFGAVGAIWFCSALGPRLLGVDLKAEARALEQRLGVQQTKPGLVSGYVQFSYRAYLIPGGAGIVGQTIAEAERRVSDHRLFALRLRRCGAIIEAAPDVVIQAGDIIAVVGRHGSVVQALGDKADEVEDRELLDIPFSVVEVLLSKPTVSGMTLEQVAELDWTRGLFLRSITRGAQQLPIIPGLMLERGDVLNLIGPTPIVDRAIPLLGPVIAPTVKTDFVVLGLAIFIGGIVGILIRIPVGGFSVALGTSVGALVAGLVVGHLRTRHPLFGRIPDGAVALMTALGLAAFVALTGLHAGPVFLPAVMESGIGLLLGGVAVTFVPLLVGLFFGRYVLKMNPILLLGGLAGALTMTAGMAAVQTRSESPVAVLGYTPAYPIANILLTLWGSLIVVLMAG
jgi:putative transport protein